VVLPENEEDMKPNKDDFRKARDELGMTASQLAKTLRMGRGADRTIRRYESGQSPVPGPVSVAVEALMTGFRPEEYDD
jgi:transcriptional regulator with XRE-family HTH domain